MKVDFSMAWQAGARILNGIIAHLPNVILGILILALLLVVASLARSIVRRVALRCDSKRMRTRPLTFALICEYDARHVQFDPRRCA